MSNIAVKHIVTRGDRNGCGPVHKFIERLREQGKEIRIDRQRVKAQILAEDTRTKALALRAQQMVTIKHYNVAKLHNNQSLRAEHRASSLHKLDYNLAAKQRAIGIAIQQCNNVLGHAEAIGPYLVQSELTNIKENFIVRILNVPMYGLRHGEFPNGW